ncbi:MAG: hypothetical protein MH252_08385 [Thermosynechococcaceae cyanobacterium MS004]|nr:hypothetical protein [Thermosynechococcaceae cyanobacterium MS004]
MSQIYTLLCQRLPAAVHHQRRLPGGGTYIFVPWRNLCDHFHAHCPSWQVAWGTPVFVDAYCVVDCTITIDGVQRSAIGNAIIEMLSADGKDMSRGTPIERAAADAFRNAAELWGVGAYLRDQGETRRWLAGQGWRPQ